MKYLTYAIMWVAITLVIICIATVVMAIPVASLAGSFCSGVAAAHLIL